MAKIVVKKSKRQFVGGEGKAWYEVWYKGKFVDAVPRSQVPIIRNRIKADEQRDRRMADSNFTRNWK